jgi:hypothetical protein
MTSENPNALKLTDKGIGNAWSEHLLAQVHRHRDAAAVMPVLLFAAPP